MGSKSMCFSRPEIDYYTVKDQGLDSVTEEIKHKNPNHTMKLYEIEYFMHIVVYIENWNQSSFAVNVFIIVMF